MKATRWIMSVVAFFIVAKAFATGIPKLNVVTVEAEKVLVDFRSVNPTLFEMTLQNSDGEIVYFKKPESPLNKYTEELDFSEMEDGEYTICVNYGNCSVNREVFVSESAIKVGPQFQLYEPYFCLKSGALDISFMNVSQKNVFLKIFQNGQYIAGTCLGNDMALQKRVDVKDLKDGNYELVLTDWFKDHPFVVQK